MPPCAGPGQRVGAGQPAPGFSARQPKRRWTSGASLRPPGFGTPRQTPRGTGMLRPPATACANAEKGGGRVHAKPDGSSSACTAAGRRRCKGCGAKAAALTSRSWLLGGASCSGVAFERTPAMRPTAKNGFVSYHSIHTRTQFRQTTLVQSAVVYMRIGRPVAALLSVASAASAFHIPKLPGLRYRVATGSASLAALKCSFNPQRRRASLSAGKRTGAIRAHGQHACT